MPKLHKLSPGEAAPEGSCLTKDGQTMNLSDLWRDGPVLLTFLRHFG